MRVQHQIILTVSDDAGGQLGEFNRSAAIAPVVLDGFTASCSGTFYLPDTQQPVGLSLGDLPAGAGFYLEVDGAAMLVINGGASLALLPGSPGALAKVFGECAVSSLSVTSSTAGVAVRGRYTVWGQQPPLSAD